VWRFLKKLEIELPYDPAIPLLGIHTEETRGMVWGGRREEGSGWGTRVYLWRIHFDIRQNQYNIVKLKK